MKLVKISLAAALAVSALGLAGTASAQDHHGDRQGDRHGNWHGDRHHGWNNGHHGWGRRCWTTWRHHHRERVCR